MMEGSECDPCHLTTQQVLRHCHIILGFYSYHQILSGGLLCIFGVFPIALHLCLMVRNMFLIGTACKKKKEQPKRSLKSSVGLRDNSLSASSASSGWWFYWKKREKATAVLWQMSNISIAGKKQTACLIAGMRQDLADYLQNLYFLYLYVSFIFTKQGYITLKETKSQADSPLATWS